MIRCVRSFAARPFGTRQRKSPTERSKVMNKYQEDKVRWEMVSPQDDKPLLPLWSESLQSERIFAPAAETASSLVYGVVLDAAAQMQHCEDPPAQANAPSYLDIKLPVELWNEVFSYIDDGYDIHALARTCRVLQDVAKYSIEKHAAFVETHKNASIHSYESTKKLLRLVQSSPRTAYAIRNLVVDRATPDLLRVIESLPNLRSLTVHMKNPDFAWMCHRAGSLDLHLPHLRSFTTSVAYTDEIILPFIARHPRLLYLSVPEEDPKQKITIVISPLPSRVLSCGLQTLLRFSKFPHLTHLHILVHLPQTLDRVAALLGGQLCSLRLGMLQQLPELNNQRAIWSPQDILTRFPHLRYIQIHMFEPDFVPHPIQWQHKRDRSVVLDRPAGPLTVAWVLEEEAWGTVLDPRDSDQVRHLFEEVAFDVLRYWTPYIERIVYGDMGVPNTSVRLSDSRNGVVHASEDSALGEMFWSMV